MALLYVHGSRYLRVGGGVTQERHLLDLSWCPRMNGMVVENYTFKVLLPEGAEEISVQSAGGFGSAALGKSWGLVRDGPVQATFAHVFTRLCDHFVRGRSAGHGGATDGGADSGQLAGGRTLRTD